MASAAGEGAMATLLLCRSTLERRASERGSESESEHVGAWRAGRSPFWHGRVGQHQWTTATWRMRPASVGHDAWGSESVGANSVRQTVDFQTSKSPKLL